MPDLSKFEIELHEYFNEVVYSSPLANHDFACDAVADAQTVTGIIQGYSRPEDFLSEDQVQNLVIRVLDSGAFNEVDRTYINPHK